MAKDYKKSPTAIKNYNELIEKLKLIDVSPQEAYSLAFKFFPSDLPSYHSKTVSIF